MKQQQHAISLVTRIEDYNKNRIPHLLLQKYRLMQQDAFSFFRGSCHLFYEDWPKNFPPGLPLNKAPAAWLCGDLHLENFGTFKGSNGQTYFDLNDFDEAVLGPCTWDLARFLVSIRIGAQTLEVDRKQAASLCEKALQSYCHALACGRAEWVDRATADGMIGDLLDTLGKRKRVDLLDRRCPVGKDGKRQLLIDNDKLEAVDAATRKRLKALLESYAATQPDPKFFKLVDCAFRVAGTGSRGLPRYALLIRGKGSPDANYLLDLKYAPASALARQVKQQQPAWGSESQRIIAVQHRMQAMSPRFSAALSMDGEPYVLRALQPTEDRLNLAGWNNDFSRLETVVGTMGRLLAWSQLRSSGRQGSAIADELISFGQGQHWQQDLLDCAEKAAAGVVADWKAFAKHVFS